MSAPTQVAQDRAWLELPDGKLHPFAHECRVGRSPKGNDLVIDTRAISSRHAIISASQGIYTLVDLHSTNGTYLNGLLVQKPMRVKDGDEIRLAKVVALRFRRNRDEPAPTVEDLQKTTEVLQDFEGHTCWLLLADVEGFSHLIARHGDEAALHRLQTWIAEMRPLIEGNAGTINRYVGDAIFACWTCSLSTPADLLAAAHAIENYRARAPVAFRFVVHHGSVLFTRSEVGEELTGQEVNFLFRSEKIAKRLDVSAALSESAMRTLGLEGRCAPAGSSAVEGIDGCFTFFRFPPDIAGGGSGPGFAKRTLLVDE